MTIRSVLVGLVLALGLNLAAPYVGLVVHSQFLATSYFPVGLGVTFFVAVLGANGLVRAARPRWALRYGELAVVFVMAAVASTMPTHGISGKLLSFISAPHYLASPENRWGAHVIPYLPRWAVVESGAPLRWFYEGLPPGESVPWSAWAGPLLWWVAFLGAAWFACLCVICILRRQWMEHERLAYPLAEMATALIRRSEGGATAGGSRRPWVFWLGFGLAAGTLGWNAVGYFVEGWPAFPGELPAVGLGRDFPALPLVLYWPMLCIAFFLTAQVSLSLWVFIILGVVEEGAFNRLGFSIRDSLSVPCFDASRPALAWQSYGAMVAMVGMNLWVARRYLGQVLRKAWRPQDPCLDDGRELLSSRTAVVGLAVAGCFMGLWLWRLGMRPGTAAVFLVAALVGFIGLSRLVVEGGLVFILPPLTPQSATVTLLGNSALGPSQLAAVGLSMGWVADPINAFMPATSNAVKVSHRAGADGRRVVGTIVLAVVAGLTATILLTIWIGYRAGAYTTGTWLFHGAPHVPYSYVMRAIGSEPGVEWAKLSWGGIGAGLMLALTALHHRLSWWPLHPIGLVVGVIYKVRWCFLPLFAGWLCKVVVLRVGGAAALQRAKPFFLGAMVGWFAGAGLSVLVDVLFFPGQGHVICWH
ncbi:MAG: DUF6785 family protein [Candidatus Brocadiia bacterium]